MTTFAITEEWRKSETQKFSFPICFYTEHFLMGSTGLCFRTPLYSVYHRKYPGQYYRQVQAITWQVLQCCSRFILSKILSLFFLGL